MEWARHRFRFCSYLPNYLDRNPTNNNAINPNDRNNPFRLVLKLLIVVSVISVCSPVALSLEIRDQTQRDSGGDGSVSNFSAVHREILHSADRNRDSVSVKNISGAGVPHSKNGESSVENVNESHPHISYRKGKPEDKDCNNTEESHKIESILRDIFFDEFGPEESLNDDDVEDMQEIGFSDSADVGRVGLSVEENVSHIPNSRRGRSEPPLFPEGGRGSRGKGKGQAKDSLGSQENKHGSKGRNKQKKAGSSKGSDLSKYNVYMDAVFSRMNAMIKVKRMDPLRVNLYAGPSKVNQKKGGGSGSRPNKNKKHSPRMDLGSGEEEQEIDEDMDEDDFGTGPARKDIFLNGSRDDQSQEDDHDHDLEHDQEESDYHVSSRKIREILESIENNSTVPFSSETSDSDLPRGNESKPKKPKGSNGNRNKENGSGSANGKPKEKGQKGSKNKTKGSGSGSESDNKNKNKNKKSKSKGSKKTKPTRGILHGLSTLKRDGNVAVIKQGDKARIVRANFLLGPVSLEIMPRKSKAEDGADPDKKPVAATATAPKLRGVLEVRLKTGSPTRIRKLRVYPPKNVKVDGAVGSTTTHGVKSRKPQQYGKVTPMATARLRQIASTVVRQTDKKIKSSTS